MTATSALIHANKLLPEAILQAHLAPGAIAAANTEAEAAAAAIVAGLQGPAPFAEELLARFDEAGLAGQAAAWAWADEADEQALLTRIPQARLDWRENAYRCLAHRIARDLAGADLVEGVHQALTAELARIEAGGSGLGERCCQLLAMCGDARTLDAIAHLMRADRFCDRFELERLRKSFEEHGRDVAGLQDFAADWQECFAAHLGEVPLAEVVDAETTIDAEAVTAEAIDDEVPDDEAPAEGAIDWAAFAASPQAGTLDEQIRSLVTQLGPVIEQIAAQAVGKPLLACNEQEVAAIFLQVLPQSLPPQYVQAALSPQGLNSFKALIDYLDQQQAGSGAALQAGLGIVREQIQASMRASGSLQGSLYDDTDDDQGIIAP